MDFKLKLRKGTVVQIVDEDHPWFPSIIIVSESKSFGIQGYTVIVTNDGEPNGQAYIRLKDGQYEIIGMSKIVTSD